MPKRASLNQAGVRRRSTDSHEGSYIWANAEDAIEGKGAAQVGAITVKSRTKLPMINGLMSVCITVND
jgi:hypothetical protein